MALHLDNHFDTRATSIRTFKALVPDIQTSLFHDPQVSPSGLHHCIQIRRSPTTALQLDSHYRAPAVSTKPLKISKAGTQITTSHQIRKGQQVVTEQAKALPQNLAAVVVAAMNLQQSPCPKKASSPQHRDPWRYPAGSRSMSCKMPFAQLSLLSNPERSSQVLRLLLIQDYRTFNLRWRDQ